MIFNPVISSGGGCPWKEIVTASEFDSRVQDGEYGAILFLVDGYQSFLVPYALGFEYGTIKAYIYDITNPTKFITPVVGGDSVSGPSSHSIVVLNEEGSEVYVAIIFDTSYFQFAPGWSARYFIFEG